MAGGLNGCYKVTLQEWVCPDSQQHGKCGSLGPRLQPVEWRIASALLMFFFLHSDGAKLIDHDEDQQHSDREIERA